MVQYGRAPRACTPHANDHNHQDNLHLFFSALYPKRPYYLVLYMQGLLFYITLVEETLVLNINRRQTPIYRNPDGPVPELLL